MRKPVLLVVLATAAVALNACGDDTSKTNNTSTPASDMGTLSDTGGGGSDTGGGGTDTGGGGTDTGGTGADMGGGADTGTADMGSSDAGGSDAGGADVGDPMLCGNAAVDPGEDCDDGNMDDTDDCNSDCTFTCGDEVLGARELCDIAIMGGPGECPAACDDADACTTDALMGAECQAQCVYTDITACVNADGCCPAGCDANTDDDCTNVCGNNTMEPGEQCDDGNTMDGDGCDSNCQIETPIDAFRMSDLDLVDPHIYLQAFGCRDITNGNVPLNLSPPINALLENAITLDEDSDGVLDLSFVAIFRPLDQTNGATGAMSIAEADCTAPAATTTCTVDPAVNTIENGTYTVDDNATCLDAIAGTTFGYTPAVDASVPSCFSTSTIDFTVSISGIPVPLTDVQVGATFVGDPATGLSHGLLRGFISEATADTVLLPTSIPLVGGDPLSSVLPGGTGNCASHDDRDLGPDGQTMGWWFYLNFPADKVVVTEL